ncbi:UNVERIFIED_CONTAM: hypothetical protein FKN15_005696 [Acipenser sinensis]
MNDAGNYTCMYGKENPGDVKNISHGSSVYLNVRESSNQFILQLDKQSAMEGMDVSFICMIPDEFRVSTGKESFFHLYKNGRLVDSQPDPKGKPGVTFSIKKVKRSDTGNYTCVYGKEKLVNSNSKRSHPVYLHVAGSVTSPSLGAGVGCGVLVLLLLLIGGVLKWLQSKREPLRTAILQIGKTTVVEREKVEFKCVIAAVHGEQPKNKENWFHLYKNREKISSLPEPGGMGAVTFIKQDIRKNDAGDYTCMYGKENPGDVKNISHGSSVYLNVKESSNQFIFQLDKQSAVEGMDGSFKCMIPVEFRDATGKERFFHLYKNGSLVDSQPDPKGIPAVKFSIKKVKRSDTGNYTCVYGKEKLVNSANNKRSHPVYLHVTGRISLFGQFVLYRLAILISIQSVNLLQNQPKQPSKQQEDTLTYSEINTARVTKKKRSSAPDKDNVTYATVKSKV